MHQNEIARRKKKISMTEQSLRGTRQFKKSELKWTTQPVAEHSMTRRETKPRVWMV